MKFWKMHGAGNDFIIINNIVEKIDSGKFPYLAEKLCTPRLSLGADGLMVIEDSDKADFKMLFYNADGSVGEMCGNGARCICRYAYENDLSSEMQIIETGAGIVKGERIDKRNYKVRLNDPEKIIFDGKAEISGEVYNYSYVELGNPGLPHAVVPMKNLKDLDEEFLFNLGKEFRYYKAFPKGANVNFYEITGEDELFERTWERGVEGFTYACGTGTGSVVAVLTLLNKVSGKNVKVDMRGGTLIIDINLDDGKVADIFLTGPTNIVAKGEITDEDISI